LVGAPALAAGKKNARALNAWLVFVDESAFSQRPPVRATWAPKGRTPVIVEPFNWRRLSGIGAVLTKASGRRLRWLLALHRGNIGSAQLVRFLNALRRHRRRPVILLWDRLPAHRSRRMAQTLGQQRAWLQVEWLPAYAPELNPVEPLWDYLDDTALANTPMENLGRLRQRLRSGLRQLDRRPSVGRGLLRYTGLF
jgi:transposase